MSSLFAICGVVVWAMAFIVLIAWAISKENLIWIAVPALFFCTTGVMLRYGVASEQNVAKDQCEGRGGEWVWVDRTGICLKKGCHLP